MIETIKEKEVIYEVEMTIADRHKEIERLTKEYLDKGGVITLCPLKWPKKLTQVIKPRESRSGRVLPKSVECGDLQDIVYDY